MAEAGEGGGGKLFAGEHEIRKDHRTIHCVKSARTEPIANRRYSRLPVGATCAISFGAPYTDHGASDDKTTDRSMISDLRFRISDFKRFSQLWGMVRTKASQRMVTGAPGRIRGPLLLHWAMPGSSSRIFHLTKVNQGFKTVPNPSLMIQKGPGALEASGGRTVVGPPSC